MLTDYHTHSARCGHAVGSMDEYIDRAIARGISEIGLTDHLYLYFLDSSLREKSWAMAEETFDEHYREMLELRERYRDDIEVRVSVEADFVPGHEDQLDRILGQYEFDYILGGVHFVRGWLIDDPATRHRYKEESVTSIYRHYYENLQLAIASGRFDLIAHFDLPKKFGDRPETSLDDCVAATLDLAAERNVTIEVSSAGLRMPACEIYPSRSILQEMRQREIPIALSSDAHDPAHVGDRFDELLRQVWDAGYRELATFHRRERRMQPIG